MLKYQASINEEPQWRRLADVIDVDASGRVWQVVHDSAEVYKEGPREYIARRIEFESAEVVWPSGATGIVEREHVVELGRRVVEMDKFRKTVEDKAVADMFGTLVVPDLPRVEGRWVQASQLKVGDVAVQWQQWTQGRNQEVSSIEGDADWPGYLGVRLIELREDGTRYAYVGARHVWPTEWVRIQQRV